MLTRTWRRFRSPAALALAMTLCAPLAAFAQQGGLLPNWPIRRERVPCPMEDPVYGVYREQYFGYHPTCWRRFPAGWGCPSPEAPNSAKAFQERKRDTPPPMQGDDMGVGPNPDNEAMPMPGGVPAPGPNANPALPPLPGGGERSPFELDKPSGAPPARPGAQPPADRPGDPLDLPPAASSIDSPPAAPSVSRSDLIGGTGNASAAASRNAPISALPDPLDPPSSVGGPSSDPGPSTSTTPVQAPRRTSMLSGFFSGFSRTLR
jgi:hypothetical protein